MQTMLEQIEREKRDASDLAYSFPTKAAPCKQEIEILKKKNNKRVKTLRSQKDVRCCKLQQSFETHYPHQ